jgi:guanylate kinase
MKPLFILISGPSGGGKTTLASQLISRRPHMFDRLLTCTTRQMRPGEVDGADYHFRSLEEFSVLKARGQLAECACVYGNWYGSLIEEVDSKLNGKKHVLAVLDIQGAAAFRNLCTHNRQLNEAMVSIFLLPPSVAEIKMRLQARGSLESLDERLGSILSESQQYDRFHYTIVTEDLMNTVEKAEALISAETSRSHRVSYPLGA